MTDVFISYKRAQRPEVEAIAQALRDLELEVWFDRELTPGREFPAEIERKAREARAMIVCWTPEATQSRWVLREAEIGRDRDVLAPVYLKQCALPCPYDTLHTIDLAGWKSLDDPRWLDMLRRVNDLLDRSDLCEASIALAYGRRGELVARVRGHLVQLARKERIITYKDLAQHVDVDQPTLWAALDAVAEENRARREPPLCALVVAKETGLPGRGYFQKQTFLHDHMDPLATAIWGRHRDRVWCFSWPEE